MTNSTPSTLPSNFRLVGLPSNVAWPSSDALLHLQRSQHDFAKRRSGRGTSRANAPCEATHLGGIWPTNILGPKLLLVKGFWTDEAFLVWGVWFLYVNFIIYMYIMHSFEFWSELLKRPERASDKKWTIFSHHSCMDPVGFGMVNQSLGHPHCFWTFAWKSNYQRSPLPMIGKELKTFIMGLPQANLFDNSEFL